MRVDSSFIAHLLDFAQNRPFASSIGVSFASSMGAQNGNLEIVFCEWFGRFRIFADVLFALVSGLKIRFQIREFCRPSASTFGWAASSFAWITGFCLNPYGIWLVFKGQSTKNNRNAKYALNTLALSFPEFSHSFGQ